MKTSQLLLSLFGAAALAVSASAVNVTLNTSALTAGGTYYVDFQLNDGSGSASNSAAATGFNFGGGAATGDINLIGGASGDMTSGVNLTDSSAFNEFYQSFTAGSFLSFNLWLSNNLDAPVPDIFGFAILDENQFNLGTFSLGTDQFLTAELNGGDLIFATFAGVGGVSAPAIPDTGATAALVAAAMVGLVTARRRQQAA